MTTFVVLTSAPQVIEAIKTVYANDHFQYTDTEWFVADEGVTAQEVHRKLVPSPTVPPQVPPTVVICSIVGYYGVARKNLWEWFTAKGSAVKHGSSTA